MTRPKFYTQPQRSNGAGYIPCELHQATSFAVIREEHLRRMGKLYRASRVIERFSTKTQADLHAEANNKRFEPLGGYKLGRRIIKKGT